MKRAWALYVLYAVIVGVLTLWESSWYRRAPSKPPESARWRAQRRSFPTSRCPPSTGRSNDRPDAAEGGPNSCFPSRSWS